LNLEQELFSTGIKYVAGVDEVGRGALAGPVSVGVAIVSAETSEVPLDCEIASKSVEPLERN
jgi:ribonuclease HII